MNLPIFVVNLDKSPDRLESISTQLNDLGMDFTRIRAVDGSTLSDDYPLVDKERFLLEQKRPVVAGEIGCGVSHRLIWKEIVEKKIPYALVLEDDITVDKSIKLLIDSMVYEKFDFLNLSRTSPYPLDHQSLSTLYAKKIIHRPSLFSKNRNIWKQIEWRRRWKIFHLHYYDGDKAICECDPAPVSTGGYILSMRAARNFLKTSNKIFFPIDFVWRYSGGALRQAFIASPLIYHSENASDIPGRRRLGNKLTLKRKIKRFFLKSRRIRRRLDLLKLYGIKIY